jgi:hypothetical protein
VLPLPLVDDVTVSHDALLDAVQAQAAAVVRAVEPVPPAAATPAPVGLKANEHPDAWLTVNSAPPTLIAPLRAGPELAATP